MPVSAVVCVLVLMAIVIVAIDVCWLILRSKFHNWFFETVQGSPLTPRLLPAIGVYLLLPIIIYLTAVSDAKDLYDAARRGAITGFLIYAFYDLTNYATFSRWTLHMTLTDTLWGTTLCAAGAIVGYYALHFLKIN